MEDQTNHEEILTANYLELKEILETGLAKSQAEIDPYHAKGHLIEIQSHFKGLMLRREEREELYNRLQDAFTLVNKLIDDARQDFELGSLSNYSDLKPLVDEIAMEAITSQDLKATWDRLLDFHTRLKAAKLTREHREALFNKLQEAFGTVKTRRDENQKVFEDEAGYNYLRLKELVNKGLKQAEESHEYKETREFLKKIQSEFKGVRMVHEKREELYARLQTAFDILSRRIDDYFRNKKKNWSVKMQFNVSRYAADIYELQQALEKEEEYLNELEDQLEIVRSAGKESEATAGLLARIASTRKGIREKKAQIQSLEEEKNDLQNKLDNPL